MEKFEYEYITVVGGELFGKISYSEFKSIVESVLDDPIGWKQYNIHFTYMKGKTGDISIEDAKLIKYPILKIYIRGETETDKICEMRGLSCTRFKQNETPIDIIINYKNWMGGSKSKLPITDYRKYIINHEVGHWLGLEHSNCPLEECKKRGIEAKDCPASIMQQMSKGLKHLAPCGKETCTPLPPDWGVDNPHQEKKHMHDDSGDTIDGDTIDGDTIDDIGGISDNVNIEYDNIDDNALSLKTISIDGSAIESITTVESTSKQNTPIFIINMAFFIIFIIILVLVIIIVIFIAKMTKNNS